MQTTIVGNPESALSVQGPSRDLTICLKITEMVQYIIEWYSTVYNGTVQHRRVQYSIEWYSTMYNSTVQHRMVQYSI